MQRTIVRLIPGGITIASSDKGDCNLDLLSRTCEMRDNTSRPTGGDMDQPETSTADDESGGTQDSHGKANLSFTHTNFAFNNRWNVPQSGKKLYECEFCTYSSQWATAVKRHQRKHTGEKPYRCDVCEYSAARACTLATHKYIHSGEKPRSGEKRYGCALCDLYYTTPSALATHELTHTSEKPFGCDLCDYATVYRSALARHIKRKHTGEKPHKCDRCDYSAASASDLTRHRRTHSKNRTTIIFS